LAIRVETAKEIEVELIKIAFNNQNINIALIGNPNTGKNFGFNQLTGLNQQVGNYPGITVEKKNCFVNYPITLKVNILDFTWNF
jgi:Fe2+ transport system protein B